MDSYIAFPAPSTEAALHNFLIIDARSGPELTIFNGGLRVLSWRAPEPLASTFCGAGAGMSAARGLVAFGFRMTGQAVAPAGQPAEPGLRCAAGQLRHRRRYVPNVPAASRCGSANAWLNRCGTAKRATSIAIHHQLWTFLDGFPRLTCAISLVSARGQVSG